MVAGDASDVSVRLFGVSRAILVDLALIERTSGLSSVPKIALAIAGRVKTGGELDNGILGCALVVSNVSNLRYKVMWFSSSQIHDSLSTP